MQDFLTQCADAFYRPQNGKSDFWQKVHLAPFSCDPTVWSLPISLFMYLKEKQYKIAMILLCPVQGPWASSYEYSQRLWHGISGRLLLLRSLVFSPWWLTYVLTLRPVSPKRVMDSGLGFRTYLCTSILLNEEKYRHIIKWVMPWIPLGIFPNLPRYLAEFYWRNIRMF